MTRAEKGLTAARSYVRRVKNSLVPVCYSHGSLPKFSAAEGRWVESHFAHGTCSVLILCASAEQRREVIQLLCYYLLHRATSGTFSDSKFENLPGADPHALRGTFTLSNGHARTVVAHVLTVQEIVLRELPGPTQDVTFDPVVEPVLVLPATLHTVLGGVLTAAAT